MSNCNTDLYDYYLVKKSRVRENIQFKSSL